jgi:hypothetical protein
MQFLSKNLENNHTTIMSKTIVIGENLNIPAYQTYVDNKDNHYEEDSKEDIIPNVFENKEPREVGEEETKKYEKNNQFITNKSSIEISVLKKIIEIVSFGSNAVIHLGENIKIGKITVGKY